MSLVLKIDREAAAAPSVRSPSQESVVPSTKLLAGAVRCGAVRCGRCGREAWVSGWLMQPVRAGPVHG
jgi:hypothetical protein